MNANEPVSALEDVTRIGVIGDVHGDVGALLTIADSMRQHGVDVLLVLGDLGLLWPGSNWGNALSKVAKRLAARNQVLFWVDGNHEDHRRLQRFPIEPDGTRQLRPNIIHLPRGFRTRLASGKTFAAFGGANSIDLEHRAEDLSWWAEEAITDADIETLGGEHADVLAGHDAPLDLPTLDHVLAASDKFWSSDALAYARAGREKFHQGFLRVTPELYLGGHYHQPIDETVGFYDGEHGFATRVVLLDEVQNGTRACSSILDVATLQLRFFTTGGKEIPANCQVTELHEGMTGRWMVHTLGSRHLIDLDTGTVQRLRGPDSPRSTSDGVHNLRTLDLVRIGRPGRWTMRGDYVTDFYWHVSSVIRHLERLGSSDPPS